MSNPKERNRLLEEVGLLIEERLGISPLAARIYALLTISSYEGLHFEEIREIIKASKSSTSVNINVLLQLEYISYHTKPGDRKRYFKVAKYYQLESLAKYHQSLTKEIEMVDRINAYNKKYHPIKFTPEKSVGNIAQNYLKKTQDLVKTTIENLKNLRNTDT